MTEESLFKVLGSPESAELARLDDKPLSKSLPSQLVEAVSWVDWIDEDEEDLRIIDLGEAFLQGEIVKSLPSLAPCKHQKRFLLAAWTLGLICGAQVLS